MNKNLVIAERNWMLFDLFKSCLHGVCMDYTMMPPELGFGDDGERLTRYREKVEGAAKGALILAKAALKEFEKETEE